MRRLLSAVLLTGLVLAAGCKEEKTIPPKEVPPPPKGPPVGASVGGGADKSSQKSNAKADQISP